METDEITKIAMKIGESLADSMNKTGEINFKNMITRFLEEVERFKIDSENHYRQMHNTHVAEHNMLNAKMDLILVKLSTLEELHKNHG